MFVYDTDGRIYRESDGTYQNIGIVMGENNSLTILTGKECRKVNEVGRVATISEIIAKFHVSPENPIKLIQTRRSTKH